MNRLLVALFALALVPAAWSHCEIPCGIYHDELRLDLLAEHAQTIRKSMKKINELSADKDENQLVRWVVNKEDHANKFQEIVYQYFMNQRIKPKKESETGYDAYVKQVTSLHRLLVLAMKCKQGTDLNQVVELENELKNFRELYLGKE